MTRRPLPRRESSRQRLAIRRPAPEIIPEQGDAAHLWHVKKLESAGRGSSGGCRAHVCAGQVPKIPLGTVGGQACGTSVAQPRVESTRHPTAVRAKCGLNICLRGTSMRTGDEVRGVTRDPPERPEWSLPTRCLGSSARAVALVQGLTEAPQTRAGSLTGWGDVHDPPL